MSEESIDKKVEAVAAETAGVIENVDDPIVTVSEMIKEEEELGLKAKALLGAHDDTICTYPEGYKDRQPLFTCITCTPDGAGVCYGCSVNCHDGHDIVELYTKRNFRCDCGNSKFNDFKCTLYEEKYESNVDNKYNHNFVGKFCHCGHEYGTAENEPDMFQCFACEDWFHIEHMKIDASSPEWTDVKTGDRALVCDTCSTSFPFIALYATKEAEPAKICLRGKDIPAVSSAFSLPSEWRQNVCACDFCQDYLDRQGCSYILNAEDDMNLYEKRNMEAEDKKHDDNAIVNELVKDLGRDGAIYVMQGFNSLKQQLTNFVATKEEGSVITAEDIKTFFNQAKRPRLDLENTVQDTCR